MDRRVFLFRAGSLVLLAPAVRILVACGDSPSSPGSNGNARGPGNLRFTSSPDAGHTHDVVLSVAVIESPPESGFDGRTSDAAAHTHQIVLSREDLAAIDEGETIQRTTSSDAGHTHSFRFSRSAAQPTEQGPYGG